MLFTEFESTADCRPLAERIFALIEDILPICRSITGDGVRETLGRVAAHLPLQLSEIPSGTKVFDWEIPREWNVREAYLADASGRRIVDFAQNNLHLMSYSTPVHRRMGLEELRPHLHSLPDRPDWTPHRTSYYRDNWGFCMPHHVAEALPAGEYEVVIDTTLAPGSLTLAECVVAGERADEVLIFTHTCHPRLCNDNASGIALVSLFGALLRERSPRLSYRIVFAPSTIGSLAWLAQNEHRLERIRAGLVVGLVGDASPLSYKRSRRGNTEIDAIAAKVVREIDPRSRVLDFAPYGYDERQFCAPGFNLPIGRLTRSGEGGYPEYHSSADDISVVSVEALSESLLALMRIIGRVDDNRRLQSTNPRGEPRLGKRGLFRAVGGGVSATALEHAMLWILNAADGTHGLHDIAASSGIAPDVLERSAIALRECGLVKVVDED